MAAPVLSAQTPSTGYISWTAFGIQFNGVSYSIAAGNTAEPFVWWRYNNGAPLLQAGPLPSDTGSDKLLPEDLVLFGNKLGTPLDIQRTSYLPGDLLVDGSVIGEALAAETVTGAKMVAGTVGAREVSADVIIAGQVYSRDGVAIGDPTVNGASIRVTRTDGYRQTDAAGVERLLFPINPSTDAPFKFDGDVSARSLTVKGSMDIQGANNKVSGQVALSNGVTRPLSQPSISSFHPSVPTFDGVFGPTWYGATRHLSDVDTVVSATAFFGGGVAFFDKTTGQTYPGPVNLAWGANNFNPVGGITSVAGSYYVLGQDGARNGDWYIYALDANFAKITERFYAFAGNLPGRPTIGNDGANIMVAVPRTNDVVVDRFRADLGSGALANGRPANQTLSLNALAGSPLSSIGEGAYDFGSPRILVTVEGNRTFHFTSAGVRDDTCSFLAADGGRVRGLAYVDGAFRSLDTSGRWATYSSFQGSVTVTGSYSWYDGVGTVRETQCSPGASFLLNARAWPRIQTDAPPDSGVAGSGVDKANRVGIYMATGANSRRLQSYLAVDATTFVSVREYRPTSITATGQLEPTSNTFIGSSAGSPGSISTTGGTGVWNGDNSGKIGPVSFSENLATVPMPDTALAIANKGYVDGSVTGWVDMAMASGWTHDSSTRRTACLTKRGTTYITIFALKSSYVANEVICNIPSAARMAPYTPTIFICQIGGNLRPVQIQANGDIITLLGGSTGLSGAHTFPSS